MTLSASSRVWDGVADTVRRAWYHWCPDCGATVCYRNEGMDDVLAIPIGAFADEDLPRPTVSIFEQYKQSWIEIAGGDIDHIV